MPVSSLPSPEGSSERELMRVSSGEQAAWHIRELIFDGELAPHSRVPQDEIAESLGISRIPLREALIALEREGWVTLELHRGAFVNAFDEASLRDHYDMLGVVYGFAARHALERAGSALVDDLRGVTEALHGEADPERAGELLRLFHLRIIEAARSPRMIVLLRAVPSLVPDDIFTALPAVVDLERTAVDAIVAAFESSDGAAASSAYETMMHAVGERVVDLFRRRQLIDTPADATSE